MEKKTIVINLFGAPGAGKSTTAAFLFGELKSMGLDVELVTEYVKDLVWDKRYKELSNQIICFGQQMRRIERLIGQVDIIITDSPLLLNAYYNKDKYINLIPLVLEINQKYNNINFFLERTFRYNELGRIHSEEESNAIGVHLKELLQTHNEPFTVVQGDVNSRHVVIDYLKKNEDFKALLNAVKTPSIEFETSDVRQVVQPVDNVEMTTNDVYDGLRVVDIRTDDMSNGDGLRVVVFVGGCGHKCKGCHNPETWSEDAGEPFTDEHMNKILEYLSKDYIQGITFSGGDPLFPRNRSGIRKVINKIKETFGDEKDIWLYTGYLYENIKDEEPLIKNKIIDVLVDGPFIQSKLVRNEFRGSSNQNIINIKEL